MSFDKEWEERLEKMNVIWQKVRYKNDESRSNSNAQMDARAGGMAIKTSEQQPCEDDVEILRFPRL